MKLLCADELEAGLRDIGARRYHNLHPFHRMLHGGRCTKGQVQAWALNRYYYQSMIPLKDAGLIARCEEPAIRREWRSRLVDHDGTGAACEAHLRPLAVSRAGETDGGIRNEGQERPAIDVRHDLAAASRHRAVDPVVPL